MAATVEELQAYFAQHAIQERLNDMLNQLVQVRPAAPYAWLAARVRGAGSIKGDALVDTCPLLPKEVGADELGARLAKTWNFCQAFSASASATVSQPAPSAAAKGGVTLSIEAGGKDSVLLTIRKS
uniref:Uncharacterized protein n=1 Tax=Calcidiscus leptoporus TaxID=127549 RepID=A0A7S0P197_9EUKA